MFKKITNEMSNYKDSSYEMFEGYDFSAYKLIRRIGLYKNKIYPSGKLDSQGNYKYWFDIITPRVNSEIKNIDFDTKDIMLFSSPDNLNNTDNDFVRVMLANVGLQDFLAGSGEAAKLNEAVEMGSEWGNVVWKKVKNDYQILDMTNVMVLNQTAKTLDESDVIEVDCMSASDLMNKSGVWYKKEVEDLVKEGKTADNKSAPEFYIYERNGELTEKEYNEAKDIEGGDENKYILAKVIVGGTKKWMPTVVLFCEEITEKPYKEYHRSSYSGRWFRVGIYELLMDIQTRANAIGNQIARGLEWASKTVFRSSDKLIAQNIMTDLQNGDLVKSTDLQQVPVRMEGLDQLIADWNRLMQLADLLANSFESVTGESSPAGTPFSSIALQNQNAGKLFDFIREKLGIAFQDLINDWTLPNVMKELKGTKILRLTGDSGILNRYYEALVDEWYVDNLISFPPHDDQGAQDIKDQKMQELLAKPEAIVKLEKEMWDGFKARARVSITGENFNLNAEMQTLETFIGLEQDPVRRTALIEIAMKKKNIDVSKLAKTPPQPPTPAPGAPAPTSGLDQAMNTQQKMLAQ